MRRSVEKPVPVEDRQGASDGARVALRNGAVPQKLGRVIRAEAEEFRKDFEEPLLGWVAAGEPRTAPRAWCHAFIVGFRGRRPRRHDMPHRAFPGFVGEARFCAFSGSLSDTIGTGLSCGRTEANGIDAAGQHSSAATALEVFIATALDVLATEEGTPAELWSWINKRDNHHELEPSTTEQFDVLLRCFTGHSLQDEPALWEAYRNLKSARNAFVHNGNATIGNTPVDAETANKLIGKAGEIIDKVREWLPEHLQWQTYKFNYNIEVSKIVGGGYPRT